MWISNNGLKAIPDKFHLILYNPNLLRSKSFKYLIVSVKSILVSKLMAVYLLRNMHVNYAIKLAKRFYPG